VAKLEKADYQDVKSATFKIVLNEEIKKVLAIYKKNDNFL